MLGNIHFLFGLLVVVAAAATTINRSESMGRIIDGDAVELGSADFMASLRSFTTNLHFCGGTILTTRTILTSAQCTNGRAASSLNVVVGTVHRITGGVPYRSSSLLIHPGFDHDTLENDISLVITATVINLSHNVRNIDIFHRVFVDNIVAEVFGWGVVAKDDYDPTNLHRQTATTISNEECRFQLQNSTNDWRITENKICTVSANDMGICYGDEGGALITNANFIVGVASWHLNCKGGVPNVYERIAPHRLWIHSNQI